MIFFLLLIITLCLYKIKIANNGYFDDFLEREQTNSIKGLFILFVFLLIIPTYFEPSVRCKRATLPEITEPPFRSS